MTGYPGLFLWCLLSGVLVPLPDDVPQVWAGMRIAGGEMSWPAAMAVAFVGVLLRDSALFGLGHVVGEQALSNRFVARIVPPARVAQARERVRARGPMAVLIGRFSIGVRNATFFTAGALGVRPRDFLLWDVIGLCVTVPLMTTLGFFFGEPVVAGVQWVAARAPWAVAVGLVVALAAWWARSRFARPAA